MAGTRPGTIYEFRILRGFGLSVSLATGKSEKPDLGRKQAYRWELEVKVSMVDKCAWEQGAV